MSVKFCPIASGSSGNSTFISTGSTNILIDAGLSGKKIKHGLSMIDEDPGDLDAIFITHEHSDHILGAAVLSRQFNIPIYATMGTWEEMDRLATFQNIAPGNKRYVYVEENLILNDICVHPFLIPHDAAEPVGYNIYNGDHKVSVSTDLGCITDDILRNISNSDILLIESNHDIDMLKNGVYPFYLKKRVLSDRGHLSNVSCGQMLCKIYDERLKHVFLGHLSEENNRPEIAFETVSNILLSEGVDFDNFSLYVANRYTASRAVSL